ncbi:MAG: hypothetical protein ACKOHJ_02350 [Vulcanococcus sp.]|jgi:hypothetical protein
MASAAGSSADLPLPARQAALATAKKKGCKQKKCSKWKGGKCRCGRD